MLPYDKILIVNFWVDVFPGAGITAKFGVADCVSKEEIPSHIPWNTGYVPSCDNDILKNQIMD